MAEVALKIGDSREAHRFHDGDVVDVFNRRRTRLCHAGMICRPRIDGRIVGGQLGETQPLLEKMYLRTARYKVERVSKTEIRRTNLDTLAEVVYGSTAIENPDRPGTLLCCHVKEHFAFLLTSGKLPLFGSTGAEVQYEGPFKTDGATVELIWDDIEATTALRRTDHDRFPLGRLDLKESLFITVDEFDDDEGRELVTRLTKIVPVSDEFPKGIEVVRERKHYVDWKADVAASVSNSATVAGVEDRKKAVDIRDQETFVRASVVKRKTLLAVDG